MKTPINIMILGKENVGKSAIVVRYLTRRYLTEYAHVPEMTYERTVLVDGKHVPLKITDISGKDIELKSGQRELPSKLDGVIVVYSITDNNSFQIADGVCSWLRNDRKCGVNIPVVLLGNKADLAHRREVKSPSSEKMEWRPDGYMMAECSASTGSEEIVQVFTTLINKILEKRDIQVRQHRKLSQNPLGSPKLIRATLKRRFSVFTRERTSTM